MKLWMRYYHYNYSSSHKVSKSDERVILCRGGPRNWVSGGGHIIESGAVPPEGSRGRAHGWGLKGEAPWSWTFLSCLMPNRGTNLLVYVVFSNYSESVRVHFFKIQYTVRHVHFKHSKVSRHLSLYRLNSKYKLFAQTVSYIVHSNSKRVRNKFQHISWVHHFSHDLGSHGGGPLLPGSAPDFV